jgi:hypothetical protein
MPEQKKVSIENAFVKFVEKNRTSQLKIVKPRIDQ